MLASSINMLASNIITQQLIEDKKRLETALQFADLQKNKITSLNEKNYTHTLPDEEPCFPCFERHHFITGTRLQKLSIEKLIDAIENKKNTKTDLSVFQKISTCLESTTCAISGFCCCYPTYTAYEQSWCYKLDCCGYYQDRRLETHTLDGIYLLAQEKLKETKRKLEPYQVK